MTQPASVGNQLLYTYKAADHCKKQAVGQARPAIVVREWGSDLYNIAVLTDGRNDFEDGRNLLHVGSVRLCGCAGKGLLHYAGSPLETESTDTEPAPPLEPETDSDAADESHVVTSPFPSVAQASAPEGAHSESSSGEGENATPAAEPAAAPAAPPAAPPKKKGGRPKKAK